MLEQAEALEVWRSVDDFDWTYVSPAAVIEAGERTGVFRVGGDDLLVDDAGESRISIPDYAMAIADELVQGRALRRRITVAYRPGAVSRESFSTRANRRADHSRLSGFMSTLRSIRTPGISGLMRCPRATRAALSAT